MPPRHVVRLLIAVLLGGCSALIEPDINRLGGGADGGDGGGGGADSGRSDAGTSDGGGGTCPTGCDDFVGCTLDTCEDGECVNTPDDAACPGERCNPVMGCVPSRCSSDAECSDGVFCNGEERCDNTAPGPGCLDGIPVACEDDGAACTMERCDEATGACVTDTDPSVCDDTIPCTVDACDPTALSGCSHAPNNAACAGDFCTTGRTCDIALGCVGGTPRPCDDSNPCTTNSCNPTLSMCENPLRDDDVDGFPAASIAPSPGGPVIVCGGTDCDDTMSAVNPSAMETCNRRDDNCNGTIDEGCTMDVPADECRTAGTISLTGTTRATITGTFSTFAHHYQTNPYCGAGANGRDAVYVIELPAGLHDVTIDTIGSVADTVLAVGVECNAAAFNGICQDDYDQGVTASRIWVHRFGNPIGVSRLFVLVDAFGNGGTGDFTLNVRRGNAGPDVCPSGIGGALPLEITGGGAVLGFQDFVGSQRGTCSPAFDTQPEGIFRVRGPTSANVHFEIFSTEFTPIAYFRQAPCGSGTELGCQVGADVGGGIFGATLDETVTAAELYWLFVDGGRTAYVVYYQPY